MKNTLNPQAKPIKIIENIAILTKNKDKEVGEILPLVTKPETGQGEYFDSCKWNSDVFELSGMRTIKASYTYINFGFFIGYEFEMVKVERERVISMTEEGKKNASFIFRFAGKNKRASTELFKAIRLLRRELEEREKRAS
jgi:hypothetical protein